MLLLINLGESIVKKVGLVLVLFFLLFEIYSCTFEMPLKGGEIRGNWKYLSGDYI